MKKLWEGKELWRIKAYTGYDAFAVVYWNEASGKISVVEETPEGQQLGSYVNFETQTVNLSNRVKELEALIGTVRELVGCEIKNVKDVTVEQHSKDIYAKFKDSHEAQFQEKTPCPIIKK